MKTSFQLVAEMNTAFGNPKGHYYAVDYAKLRSQCRNIADELAELFVALGADPDAMREAASAFKACTNIQADGWAPGNPKGLIDARDALCDIQVFAMGGQHFMGVDGDADMRAVVAGVMTRFVKDPQDLADTIAKHAAKGVTKTYTEGEYPCKILKSAEDQPDAPKGKFLKSASYMDTVFPEVSYIIGDEASFEAADTKGFGLDLADKPDFTAAWPFPDTKPSETEPAVVESDGGLTD